MTRKLRLALNVLTFAFLAGQIFAADLTGGRPDAFYTYGAGARSLGMGKAFVAVADSAEATYWNPAGIIQIDRIELSTLSATLFQGYNYNYHSVVYPVSEFVFGIHSAALSSGIFDKRDANNVSVGTFSDSKSSLGLSFATKITPELSFGMNAKRFTRTLDTSSDTVTILDLGLLYQASSKIRLGLTVLNAYGMTDATQTDDKFEINLRAGMAYQLADNILLALDLGDNLSHWYFGGEFKLHPILTLRAGANYDEFTYGVGLNVDPFRADFSMGSMDLGSSSRFSVSFKFGKSTDEMRKEESQQMNKDGIEDYMNGFFLSSYTKLQKALSRDPMNIKIKTKINRIESLIGIMPSIDPEIEIKARVEYMSAAEKYQKNDFQGAQKNIEKAYQYYPTNATIFILKEKINNKLRNKGGEE